jgi:rod shape-determining protein MreD
MRPAVGMVCVYYWIIHRPDIFNLLSVYVLGMFEDILSSIPMGGNIFTFLVLYILLLNLGRFFNGKPFIVTWYGFAILAFLAFFAKWLMLSIYYGQFLPSIDVLFSYLFSVAAYPVLSLVNAFIQNYLIQDEVLR